MDINVKKNIINVYNVRGKFQNFTERSWIKCNEI